MTHVRREEKAISPQDLCDSASLLVGTQKQMMAENLPRSRPFILRVSFWNL